ncbi:MAG TPA: hypothetical protein PL193_11640 [Xanthobacteraceae bacterium]|nr:hypothetical protein [Xanthobacteraceae bacterium]
MTVTPKVEPRKDRKPKKRGAASLALAYAFWGVAALAALGAAGSVFVWRDGKAPVAMSPIPRSPVAPQLVVNPNTEREINRLKEVVRVLASERDRLATRLDHIERSVGDITASITKQTPDPATFQPPSPPSNPEALVAAPPSPEPRPETAEPNPRTTTQVVSAAPQNSPAAQPAEVPAATRTEFAVDLGGEKTVDGLRARWATLRGNHGTALDGIRPVIHVKDGQKPGTVELRLVAGPIPNAATAARLCAKLQTSGVPCSPTVFDGQRLSLR